MLKLIQSMACIGFMLLLISFFMDDSVKIEAEPIVNQQEVAYPMDRLIRNPKDILSNKSYSDLRSMQYHIDMGDHIIETLSSDTIASMIYQFDHQYYIDYEKCRNYMVRLANQYNTYDKPRLFFTSDHQDIWLVPSLSDTFKGYQLDVDALTNQVMFDLALGSSDTSKAIWLNKGMTLFGQNDIGDSYFEISIEDQHIWLYIHHQLIADADVVTGWDHTKYETPKGVYYVRSLNRRYYMNYDNGSSLCDYFILITPNGIGIHDANQRVAFGGTIYKSNGSHGCINTPPDKAKLFFETLSNLKTSAIPVVIR